MATLRSEFLTVHPATELWWQQRDQCERCAHLRAALENRQDSSASRVLRCAASRIKRRGPTTVPYCIDARAENGPCGPEAKLFQEATK